MTPERHARIRATLDARQPDLTVLMDQVHKAHNLSAIMRSCDAVGVFAMHAVVPEGGLRIGRSASGGSRRWVRLCRHSSVDQAVGSLRSEGMQIVVADVTPEAKDFRDVDYTKPTALLVGSELDGLSATAKAHGDVTVTVPLDGMVESLNVSVATALVLFEAQRQRRLAGFYDQPRLDPELHRQLLFEWSHPQVASWCRRKGRPYPPLDEAGQITAPVTRNAAGSFRERGDGI